MPDLPARLQEALADRYVLERELGQGGMATVFLAHDLKHDRPVAIKVLHPELAHSLGPERFLREIRLTARLAHSNILVVFDSGEAAGRLWYAVPYVAGGSLRQRLGQEAQLGIPETLRIAGQVAAALAHAHGQGIVHRDIKPENILLAGDQALVADFGLAKALDASSAEKLTETGLSMGTPAYMSPEQAAGGAVDARSDLYALGCVVYEMLAGVPPFTGPTAQAILARHAVDRVPPLRTVRRTIPEPIEQAVERALAKVPSDRFDSAAEFVAALNAIDVLEPARRRRPSSKVRISAIMAAVVAAAVLVAGGFRLIKAKEPRILPSAASIAILPFEPAGGDTALARLGKDLAVTVSASLDGVGSVKTTDRFSIAGAIEGKQNVSIAEGGELARRLGASSVLRGTLVGSGDHVRLDLGLYDTKSLAPLATAITISGHRDSLAALTDSVTWALLRQMWQRGEPPSPSLSAVTTKSLPALRAYLDAERAFVAGDVDRAALAYRSAMAADSSFWLAYIGYIWAQSWSLHGEPTEIEPAVFQALVRQREALPERERLMVDALRVLERTPRLKIEASRRVTQQFPQYWPGWWLYADMLFHHGPDVGYDWSEALDAFRRVVAMNPKLAPAWKHIVDLATGRDRADASRALARLFELGYPPPGHPEYGTFLRLVDGIDGAGGLVPADLSDLADSVMQFAASSGDEQLALSAPIDFLHRGFPAAQLELNRRTLALSGLRVRVAAACLRGSAWSWATRGQWDSALIVMDQAVATYQEPLGRRPLPVQNYAMAVLGAWLGTVDPAEADRRRIGAIAAVEQMREDTSGTRAAPGPADTSMSGPLGN